MQVVAGVSVISASSDTYENEKRKAHLINEAHRAFLNRNRPRSGDAEPMGSEVMDPRHALCHALHYPHCQVRHGVSTCWDGRHADPNWQKQQKAKEQQARQHRG